MNLSIRALRAVFVLASVTAVGFFACRNQAHDQPAKDAMPTSTSGFDDLAITIHAHQGVDSPVSVAVQLVYPASFRKRPCFVAPDDMRVTVDGHSLQVTDRGGPSQPSQLSGVRIPDLVGCRTAVFRTPVGRPLEVRPTSVIVVDHGAKHGEVTVPGLLPKRTVRVLPSTTVRPGDRVTLEWSDNDRWVGSDLSTSVSLYYPDDFSVSIDRGELDVAPPRFTFRVPPIRPGHAFVTLYPGHLRLTSRAVRCSGFRSCDVSPNDHHDRLELTIAP